MRSPAAGDPQRTPRPDAEGPTWEIGATVMLPGRGLGVIVGRTTCAPLGIRREYLQIEITGRRMTIRVPVDKATEAGLRSPDSVPTVRRALAVLASEPGGEAPWQTRIKSNREKLSHGGTVDAAEVLRDLSLRALRRPLGMQERDQQARAARLLEGQIMHALRLREDEACALVLRSLPARGHDAPA